MTTFLRSLLPLLIISTASAYGQKTIQGKIVNSLTKEPVQYANIGIKNANVGTISNPDGTFSIVVPQKWLNDTLLFSSVGYTQKVIAVTYLLQRQVPVIYLNQKTTDLNPVTVSTKKEKIETFELGNPAFQGGVLETDTVYAGGSMALLIEPGEPGNKKGGSFPAYLEQARLRILRNNLRSFKFRVRLNSVNALTGAPGNDLLHENIVMESSMRNGWLRFDLSKQNIEVSQPFFITFEQILDINDRIAIAQDYKEFITKHPNRLKIDTVEIDGIKVVRQRLTGSGIDLAGTFIAIATSKKAKERFTCFERETSFGEWKRVSGIMTAMVTLSKSPGKQNSQDPAPDCVNSSATCKAEKACQQFMDETGINGMQICVSKKNKTIWNASFGYSDVYNKIPVTDATKFRINSVSKSITSLALLKLVDENKLHLDSPIQKYIPTFPAKKYPITTRQLAAHMAGFRDYDENNLDDYIRHKHYDNAIQALEVFEHDTLLFKPGTRFSYSTFGWNLIGALIESISKEAYLDYMQQNIFQPLKLVHTCGDNVKVNISNRSKFYDAAGEENDLGDVSYKYAGGGLLSTATDLVQFGNEILYGKHISSGLKETLFQTQRTSDGKETGYGLGWYTGQDKNGHRIWYHAGDSFSGSSFLIIYPDDDMVISFLANSQAGVHFDIRQIGELFYEGTR
jgi:CubicO group peptidase (beta-lactamase class C family)